MPSPAIVLANGRFRTANAKVAHGLVRGGDRFQVVAVVDPAAAGQDAGTLLDGRPRGIPVVDSIAAALDGAAARPSHCIVGVATHGGRLGAGLRAALAEAAERGLHLVNGLHDHAAEVPEIAAAAARSGVEILDLRRPRPKSELHFWTGAIREVTAVRVAVLGMDCAIGKRTTARLLAEALDAAGIRSEMIYTGQTGWMQGGRYGFVLDSVVNDYVCGELEHAVLTCHHERRPQVMVLEGQSSLRNPSGPCGAELLLAAGARAVVLQHAPGRRFFEGYEGLAIPPVAGEIDLIAHYGAKTLAVTLHGEGLSSQGLVAAQAELRESLGIPVIRPLEEGLGELVAVVRGHLTALAA